MAYLVQKSTGNMHNCSRVQLPLPLLEKKQKGEQVVDLGFSSGLPLNCICKIVIIAISFRVRAIFFLEGFKKIRSSIQTILLENFLQNFILTNILFCIFYIEADD